MIICSRYGDYCRADDQLHTVKMVPVTSLPDVFELSYYANAVMPVFAAESVLGKKTHCQNIFIHPSTYSYDFTDAKISSYTKALQELYAYVACSLSVCAIYKMCCADLKSHTCNLQISGLNLTLTPTLTRIA